MHFQDYGYASDLASAELANQAGKGRVVCTSGPPAYWYLALVTNRAWWPQFDGQAICHSESTLSSLCLSLLPQS